VKYPFDTDDLVKGSVIPAAAIELAYGVQRGTDKYGLALMNARVHVANAFRARGEVVTVTQRKHDLVVLDDPSAADYNARRFWREIGSAAQCHVRQLGVDRSRLSEEQVKRHDGSLTTQGRVLGAVREARKITLVPRERQTPGLKK
jgi:hypothetical protein